VSADKIAKAIVAGASALAAGLVSVTATAALNDHPSALALAIGIVLAVLAAAGAAAAVWATPNAKDPEPALVETDPTRINTQPLAPPR